MGDEIQPHLYMPDYRAMGDCRVCGHEYDRLWHKLAEEELRSNNAPEPKEPK